MLKKHLLILGVLLGLFYSCKTQREVLYMQDIDEIITNQSDNYKSPNIQVGDILSISVSSRDMESVMIFNPIIAQSATSTAVSSFSAQQQLQSYVVDSDGMIDFPVLGRLKVTGKSRSGLATELQEEIKRYARTPIVTVNILNYRFTVLGEVSAPGVYQSSNEKINVLEALGMAKDMTIYAKRDSVLLIRNVDNKLEKHYLNLNKADFIASDNFYIKQNDVIYVQPSKNKTKEVRVSPFNSLMISGVSIAITITTIIISLTK